MSDTIRVGVLGACGKMGREVVKAVTEAFDTELVGACDVACVGEQIAPGVNIESDLAAMLDKCKPNVVVDFAKPFVMDNVRLMISKGITPIVGTTGLAQEQLSEIERLASAAGIAAMVIPNFAIGAILMMKFAAEAARYMPNVEIIELHHDKKLDAPSGTSIKTAEMIAETRKAAGVTPDQPLGSPDDAARGDRICGIHVHSVRLPGFVAHQEVIFGGIGQSLTIRHDSIDRTSFMPGVLLAVRKAESVKGLVYGLDKLI